MKQTALLVIALLTSVAVYASGRSLTPDDYYRIQDVHGPQVSPDGLQIAYLVSHYDRDADKRRTGPLDGGLGGRRSHPADPRGARRLGRRNSVPMAAISRSCPLPKGPT